MLRFIKTRCISCGKGDCLKKPNGSWITENEGCIREVSELDANKYFHYVTEVKPQLKRIPPTHPLWKEYCDFIDYIESKPAGERWKKFTL